MKVYGATEYWTAVGIERAPELVGFRANELRQKIVQKAIEDDVWIHRPTVEFMASSDPYQAHGKAYEIPWLPWNPVPEWATHIKAYGKADVVERSPATEQSLGEDTANVQ